MSRQGGDHDGHANRRVNRNRRLLRAIARDCQQDEIGNRPGDGVAAHNPPRQHPTRARGLEKTRRCRPSQWKPNVITKLDHRHDQGARHRDRRCEPRSPGKCKDRDVKIERAGRSAQLFEHTHKPRRRHPVRTGVRDEACR